MSDMTADIETLRRGNERLQVALAEANAVRESCAQRAFRLEAEVERLREEIAALKEERRKDMAEICSLRESEESLREEVERLREELRQSSIDHTRAEVERLREALEIIAGDRPCIDSLMGNRDIAIAALRREGDQTWL